MAKIKKIDKKVFFIVVALNIPIWFVAPEFLFPENHLYSVVFISLLNFMGLINYLSNRNRLLLEEAIDKLLIDSSSNHLDRAKMYAHYGKLKSSIFELQKQLNSSPSDKNLKQVLKNFNRFA